MNAPGAQGGYTLVELLLALAIAAIILLPLTDMLRTSADSARMVRSRLDLNADASFAIERIAALAASATPGVTPAQQDWLKQLGLADCRGTRELLEAAGCTQPERSAVIVSNLDRIELAVPDPGTATLRIALTLSHPDAGEVRRVRTVRVGAYP